MTQGPSSCIFREVKVTSRDLSEIKKQIDVVVPAQELARELEAAYQRIGQKARIKGFRPGKVPRSILEQYYREDAESESIRNLVSQTYPLAVQEAGHNPIASPEIKITGFAPGQDLVYEAHIEIPPTFEVTGYQGLKLQRDKIEVKEGEVDDNLKNLRERLAQLTPVTELRKPRTEDVVVMDYQGFQEGKQIPGSEAKDYLAELGKGALLPELESGLLEMKLGEKRRISVTYPATANEVVSDKGVSGKVVEFDITLKEIKEKKLAKLDDDFAKDLGGFSTLEEVKAKIREDLKKEKEQSSKNDLRRQVVEKLIEKNSFEVPESLIRMELEGMLRQLEGNIKNQGMTPSLAGLVPDEFFQKNREVAITRVKAILIFNAVARKENISVTHEEVDRHIESMAALYGQAADTWKKYYHEKNLTPQLEAMVAEEKTLDFVLTQSKIEER